MKRIYEQDIKDIILEKRHIFLKIGYNTDIEQNHTILFEKAISYGSTICDCLIFSEEEGLIGIEIKTEYDSTKRLTKQLTNYSVVCDYVYVLCHDNHVDKVEGILKRNKFHHVGIVSYEEYEGQVLLGKYKEATKSPNKDVYTAYQMLWKEEIATILGSFKRQMNTLEQFGVRIDTIPTRKSGLGNDYVRTNASKKYLRKGDMIQMIIARIGKEEANKLLCNIFISNKTHPSKVLKFHQFKEKN